MWAQWFLRLIHLLDSLSFLNITDCFSGSKNLSPPLICSSLWLNINQIQKIDENILKCDCQMKREFCRYCRRCHTWRMAFLKNNIRSGISPKYYIPSFFLIKYQNQMSSHPLKEKENNRLSLAKRVTYSRGILSPMNIFISPKHMLTPLI